LGFLAAEEKMLQFSNPPELTPEKFEKLLPYAMVLDVDEIWGAKFQRMLSLSSAAQQYHPTWYTGGRINGHHLLTCLTLQFVKYHQSIQPQTI
jgi:hypothetical protein